MDQLGYDGAVTWLGVGSVDTMLGSLKAKQVDVLINTYSLVGEVGSHGYGKLLYDGSDPKNWDKVIGGNVPVSVNFCLQSRVERDAAQVQAWTNALVPEILLMDEPFGALDTHTKLDMHDVLLRIWEREKQTVLFVTHDLGEALTLSDRNILFPARPGRIKDSFEVPFSRPGDGMALRETAEYAALFGRIWHSLGEEFSKARPA